MAEDRGDGRLRAFPRGEVQRRPGVVARHARVEAKLDHQRDGGCVSVPRGVGERAMRVRR